MSEWSPTPRQRQVLHLLADTGSMTATDVDRAYVGISRSTATAIFDALSARGLVDVAPGRFVHGRYVRAYALTSAGVDYEEALLEAADDEAEGLR